MENIGCYFFGIEGYNFAKNKLFNIKRLEMD